MTSDHTPAHQAAQAGSSTAKRGVALLGLAVALTTVAGCAVSQAQPSGNQGHRAQGSVLSSVAGTTTSDLTSEFPSTTTQEVIDTEIAPAVDGETTGNLGALAHDAAWSFALHDQIEDMRMGPLFGAETVAPMQVGSVMLVGMRSSVLNDAGTAAFSMNDGSLLWQDRSLECQRVDLGGAVPCRQNSGAWAPFNPAAGAFGADIDPGFTPEAFGFADGVLYSARTNGAGMIEVAAGTVAHPAEYWTTVVPRAAEAMLPGEGAHISIGDSVRVIMGAAEIELALDGTPLAPEAALAKAPEEAMVVDIAQSIAGVDIANTADDRVNAQGAATWSIPSRVVSDQTVTDNKHLTYVSGDDADGTNVIRTISLADGSVVSEHSVVAGAAEPRDIQSAVDGVFAYDKQFSTIAYYPAG